MFYHIEALRKGGVFYTCWLADSWPNQFSKINSRQLWSQSVPRLCEDLLDILNTEAHNPSRRFSLRLSSQLIRGCCRIYKKQVDALYCEVQAVDMGIIRRMQMLRQESEKKKIKQKKKPSAINNKENVDPEEVQPAKLDFIVVNPSEITLREEVIPTKPPVYDGFGEEDEEQIVADLLAVPQLEKAADATVLDPMRISADISMLQLPEMVPGAVADGSSVAAPKIIVEQTIPLEAEADKEKQMEIDQKEPVILEQTISLEAEADKEKQMEIDQKEPDPQPEIPEVNIIPPPDEAIQVDAIEPEPVKERQKRRKRKNNEVQPARAKPKKRLIIDKAIIIDGSTFRANLHSDVELRCNNATDDIIPRWKFAYPSLKSLMGRPATAGSMITVNIFRKRMGMFTRNLITDKVLKNYYYDDTFLRQRESMRGAESPGGHRQSLAVINQSSRLLCTTLPPEEQTRLEMISAQPEEQPPELPADQPGLIVPGQWDISRISEVAPKIIPEEEIPTQIIERRSKKTDGSLSQGKALAGSLSQSRSSILTFTLNVKDQTITQTEVLDVQAPEVAVIPTETIEQPQPVIPDPVPLVTERLSTMEELNALIQGVELKEPSPPVNGTNKSTKRLTSNNGNETQLGSLDRTAVSLGDPPEPTPAKLFLRKEFGPVGLLDKIQLTRQKRYTTLGKIDIRCIVHFYRKQLQQPNDPKVTDKEIAAAAFFSVLQLKMMDFIIVEKQPDCYEIADLRINRKKIQ